MTRGRDAVEVGAVSVIGDYETALRRRNLSKSTLKRRIPLLRSLERWIESGNILDADPASIELFLDTPRRKRAISPRSRYHYISDIECFFDWAIEQELIDRNPAALIHRPKLGRLLPRPISEADLAFAMSAARRYMWVWIVLGAYAGMRCMEIAGLNVEDVMWHEGVLRIIGKGEVERIVPMHPLVVTGLSSFELPKRGAVFRRGLGDRWPKEAVSIEINTFLAGLGIDATAHQFRHRFATKTFEACGNVRVVQELMGHQRLDTTAIYTAFSQTVARDAVLALPDTPRSVEPTAAVQLSLIGVLSDVASRCAPAVPPHR